MSGENMSDGQYSMAWQVSSCLARVTMPLRFTIRDLLWLTLVVALAVGRAYPYYGKLTRYLPTA
jgi:hypothetical protein